MTFIVQLYMSVTKCSVEDEKLVIEFDEGVRSVYIKGETTKGIFHVKAENFETYPTLSDNDRKAIRNLLRNSNVVIG